MYIKIRDIRCQAAEILGKRGDPRGIAALLALCGDKDSLVRHQALQALEALGDTLGASAPQVEAQLLTVCQKTTEDAYVRVAALVALSALGEASPAALQALTALCQDKDKEVRRGAMQTLGKLGHAGEEILDVLYHYLETGEGNDRDWFALQASAAALRTNDVEAWVALSGGW